MSFVGQVFTWLPAWALALLLIAKTAEAKAKEKKKGADVHDGDNESDEAEDQAIPEPTPDDDETPVDPSVLPLWPLPGVSRKNKPTPGGRFGVRRPLGKKPPKRRHSGVDIGAPFDSPIVMPEAGEVVGISGWASPDKDNPHKDRVTRAVFVQLYSGPVVVFGAVKPGSYPKKGTRLERGEEVARVGMYPHGSTMLHLELWKAGTRKRERWYYGDEQPEALSDPTDWLMGTVEA